MTASENPERLLLVEGVDDKHIVSHMCAQSGLLVEPSDGSVIVYLGERSDLSDHFVIREKNGVDELLSSISPEAKVPGRQVLGIVVDANANCIRRWQAIRNQFEEPGVELPRDPVAEGAVVDGEPRVGVWLMPDNSRSGRIEDFIADMIPEDDPVWHGARDFVNNVPESLRPQPPIKAQVRAWLAVRAPKTSQIGSAIGTGHLDVSSPAAEPFLKWLTRLFADSGTASA